MNVDGELEEGFNPACKFILLILRDLYDSLKAKLNQSYQCPGENKFPALPF